MRRKITKKQLEEENRWLWYNEVIPEDDAIFMIIKQYDKKGKIIACSSSVLVPKEYRVKVPEHLIRNSQKI